MDPQPRDGKSHSRSGYLRDDLFLSNAASITAMDEEVARIVEYAMSQEEPKDSVEL
jgi:hypothetical protein